MGKSTKSCPLVATTLYGLEDVLADELESLGASNVKTMIRSVSFEGDRRLMYKTNLWCRTAIRILRPIKTFNVSGDNELYRRVKGVKWSDFLDTDGTLAVDAVITDSVFDNSHYVAQRVKDAVVDRFRAETGRRPSVDLANPDLRINLYLKENSAVLSLDSSGKSLHRRGYRMEKGEAPLNEVLAAGILALSEWDMKMPLIDPMCGSGTFVIEAAMMARNIAPGFARREFGFMRWKDYDPAVFRSLRIEAEHSIKPGLPFEIVGSDSDRVCIRQAKANAARAKVNEDIKFEIQTFEKQNPPPAPGILITNPPYGERMKTADINAFYRMIGDTLKKKYDGYRAFILAGNLPVIKQVGLRTSRRIALFNGPLESRLVKYEIYRGSHKKKTARPSE